VPAVEADKKDPADTQKEEERNKWRREVEESKRRGDVVGLARAITALRSLGTFTAAAPLTLPPDPQEMGHEDDNSDHGDDEEDYWPDEDDDDYNNDNDNGDNDEDDDEVEKETVRT
jgi:hypothetical protein